MGYCISISEQKFTIKSDNKDKALLALKKLGTGDGKNGRPIGRGGSYTSGKKNESWFSFMNDVDSDAWESLKEAMAAWSYPVKITKNGDVTGIAFDGEKQGDEDKMFAVIAPFVEPDSYIDFVGEDGEHWRYAFGGITMEKKQGRVVFD